MKGETIRETPKAVERMIEKTHPQRKYQVRAYVLKKCVRRLNDLWGKATPLALQGNEKPVRAFYLRMLENPDTKARFEKLRILKQRKRLLPEDSDIKILSEAISLKKSSNSLFFVSLDEDFCEFSKEIKEEFGLKVLRVQDLLSFKNELEKMKI